ncbi:MAG: hypothetical protein HZC55_18265 [Verrucomicrobia bacterium]|nr:hypothetical protein [Verrucomicrobiota bacterium]
MYSPDISQHTPRMYQLGKHYGIPMTAVADRLISHGLANLEAVFEWRPEMGKAGVAEVVARIDPVAPARKSA